MPDPPAVHEEAVDQVHDGQNDEQLPQARPEAARSVDGVYADEHVGDIPRKAAGFEKQAVPPDLFARRQAELHAALLYVLVIKMHHADRALADAEPADQNEQNAQPKSL